MKGLAILVMPNQVSQSIEDTTSIENELRQKLQAGATLDQAITAPLSANKPETPFDSGIREEGVRMISGDEEQGRERSTVAGGGAAA